MAVMAAFPLSLVVILSNVFFSINIDILDFFPNCSYTVFALPSRGTSDMSRTESSSAVSQDYLDFYYLSSVIPFLSSNLGPQCENGSGPQIIRPHIHDKVFFFFFFGGEFSMIESNDLLYRILYKEMTCVVREIKVIYRKAK